MAKKKNKVKEIALTEDQSIQVRQLINLLVAPQVLNSGIQELKVVATKKKITTTIKIKGYKLFKHINVIQ